MSSEIQIRNKSVGRFFKTARDRAGLTQMMLAKELGYTSPQFVSNWERGLCSPPFWALAKIVKLTKVPASAVKEVYMASFEKMVDKALKK